MISTPSNRHVIRRPKPPSFVGVSFARSQGGNQTSTMDTAASAELPINPELPTPTTMATATISFSPSPPAPAQPNSSSIPLSARVYIKVRDFAYSLTDERHLGLSDDTPQANRMSWLNRNLGGPDRARARDRARAAAALDPSSSSSVKSRRTDSIESMGSMNSSDADTEEEDRNGWGIGGWGKGEGGIGWDAFKLGMDQFSWNMGSNHHPSARDSGTEGDNGQATTTNGIFPSRKDLDMNFMDGSSDSSSDDKRRVRQRAAEQEIIFDDDDDDDDYDGTHHADEVGEDEIGIGGDKTPGPLYPGLYRALYAFEPRGMAEMRLKEDQIVRVVGRGGGVGTVGWAVVVDERSGYGRVRQMKYLLVPEGYLEAVS